MPLLRNQPGTAATNPKAHGLGFGFVNAFRTGYESGAGRCATFPDGNVVVTELPFRTPAELQTRGNLDFGTAVPLFVGYLDGYWAVTLPQIPGSRCSSALPGTRRPPHRFPTVPPTRATTPRPSRSTASPPHRVLGDGTARMAARGDR